MGGGLEEAFEGLQVSLTVPDLWQQDAVRAAREGRDVILSAPTGSGKTYVFELLIDSGKIPRAGTQAVYTVPTRALANDKWREWKGRGWNVGIATGDIAENLDAPVLVATLETQRERFLAGEGPGLLVIDEYQMIGDRQRGLNYELAIAMAPPETQLLLMSGSVRNPESVAEWFTAIGREVTVIETTTRPVPLDEAAFEGMPNQAPRRYQNFWQRIALGALLSGFGPLLIFATHRRAAEKIAEKVAEALPPDDPIDLPGQEIRQVCSPQLIRLLKKRVAVHHSGLSFQARAGVIEPLAKAGQLRVIVATMGLAAGINFSVRSVFVANRTYQDGPFEREVRPDELLQMFGRAGRRGLDEQGIVIFGDKSPRLSDARPLDLRRKNELDWPTLLRRMYQASQDGTSPFQAARDLRDRLFSRQTISIGFQPRANRASADTSQGKALFNLVPTRREFLATTGEWERFDRDRQIEVPLEKTMSLVRGKYRPAQSDSRIVSKHLPEGTRLCRIERKGERTRRYGMEMPVARRSPDSGFFLTKNARKATGILKRDKEFTREEIQDFLPRKLAKHIQPADFFDLVERGGQLYLRGHFGNVPVQGILDSKGASLVEPELRSTEITSETHYFDEQTGNSIDPAEGSAAHAWRKLGLIDESGSPTHRGILCSFFQGGEGLAIAAALEDVHYPVEDILLHAANLRAGYRFEIEELSDEGGSERLAYSCRQAYGAVNFDGYLELGIPPGYGEGAAEIVDLLLTGRLPDFFSRKRTVEFGPGDVERAFIEWLSLLRQITNAPDLDDPRWRELKGKASEEIRKRDRRSPLDNLPEIPASVLQRTPQHRISYHRL